MLKIRPDQQHQLADYNFSIRVEAYLRESADPIASKLKESELRALIARSLVTGRELDITSERELAKWALIGLLTGGKSFDDKQLKEHIRSFDRRDPTKVDSVLRDVSTAIKYRHA